MNSCLEKTTSRGDFGPDGNVSCSLHGSAGLSRCCNIKMAAPRTVAISTVVGTKRRLYPSENVFAP